MLPSFFIAAKALPATIFLYNDLLYGYLIKMLEKHFNRAVGA